jgi:hypothetical protein
MRAHLVTGYYTDTDDNAALLSRTKCMFKQRRTLIQPLQAARGDGRWIATFAKNVRSQ